MASHTGKASTRTTMLIAKLQGQALLQQYDPKAPLRALPVLVVRSGDIANSGDSACT